ncbi:MAG: methyltransferase domain-containing protein [Rhodoglobus sp.]
MSALFDASDIADNYRLHLEPWLFAPWAERLVEFAALEVGQTVLDVASGTGVVARAAASTVGPTGRVIASDISERMLAKVSQAPGGEQIETLPSPATALDLPDASVDVVLCQQGFQFIRDQPAAVAEFLRVLRPGGVIAVAVWTSGVRLDPFDAYADALRAVGQESEFGQTVGNDSLTTTTGELAEALAGFDDIQVRDEHVLVRWDSLDDEVAGIFGTPFGPVVEALAPDRRDALLADLRERLAGSDGGTVEHDTVSVLASGIRPA